MALTTNSDLCFVVEGQPSEYRFEYQKRSCENVLFVSQGFHCSGPLKSSSGSLGFASSSNLDSTTTSVKAIVISPATRFRILFVLSQATCQVSPMLAAVCRLPFTASLLSRLSTCNPLCTQAASVRPRFGPCMNLRVTVADTTYVVSRRELLALLDVLCDPAGSSQIVWCSTLLHCFPASAEVHVVATDQSKSLVLLNLTGFLSSLVFSTASLGESGSIWDNIYHPSKLLLQSTQNVSRRTP